MPDTNKKSTPSRRTAPRKNRPLQAVESRFDEPTLDDLLRDLPDDFLQCRSYNKHNVKPLTVFAWGKDGDCICRVSKCSSCGCRIEDYYLPNGQKMDRQYVYPKNYLITGYGKVPTDLIMRILMSRTEIVKPEDVPNRITRHLSNKGLRTIRESVGANT